ncbi:MAG: sugar phosphate nucleotidyltransferase, partial [Candidatus Kuenenia sp.]
MEAIILAGGYGTRLQSVIKDIPKPMADINGRPFLSYLMDYLLCQNIRKILLSVGYKHEIIKNYFGLRYKNLDIEYVIEDKPLGTGGAIKEALKWVEGDD